MAKKQVDIQNKDLSIVETLDVAIKLVADWTMAEGHILKSGRRLTVAPETAEDLIGQGIAEKI